MPMEANILVYTKSAFIYNRIENAFSHNHGVHVICSISINDCIYKIHERAAYLSCVIVYSDSDEKEYLLEIAKIRAANRKIPIILITSGNTVSFIHKVINHGVNDIILMPFTDQFLIERVYRIINKGSEKNKNVEIISLSLFKYLNGELKKAQKGNYPLSMMLTTLQYDDEEKYSKKQKNFFLDVFSDNLKGLYFETDLFIRFDQKYYLGVFPFCSSKNESIILSKNTERFNRLVLMNMLPADSRMITAFVSYPDNMNNIVDGFKVLMKTIRKDFSDHDLEIYFDEYGQIDFEENEVVK